MDRCVGQDKFAHTVILQEICVILSKVVILQYTIVYSSNTAITYMTLRFGPSDEFRGTWEKGTK